MNSILGSSGMTGQAGDLDGGADGSFATAEGTSGAQSSSASNSAQTHLVIDVSYDSSVTSLQTTDPALYAGYTSAIQTAVQFYENEITNPVTINITFGWGEVNGNPITSPTAIAESDANFFQSYSETYPQLYNAVRIADTNSAVQTTAVASLPTTDPTGGAIFTVVSAEAKALGLAGPSTATDGFVGLNSSVAFSWSQSDIASGTHDAVGALEHEISEDMGRTDELPPFGYTLLGLFRYTAADGLLTDAPGSPAGVLDEPFVPGYDPNAFSYFSYDGKTVTLPYDTPVQVAAQQDVADWTSKAVGGDSYGASQAGVEERVSTTDLEEMNVLGWNVIASSLPPAVASVTPSPGAGVVTTGALVTLTVAMTGAVTVSGGTPSLALNDGGTAIYDASRSTPTALAFDYIVAANQRTSALAVAGFNANGATIADANGNSAGFSGVLVGLAGLMVNVVTPTVVSVAASPGSGDVLTGGMVTLTVSMSTPVTVSGGTPNLTLNDGGVATYDAAKSSGTVLVFDYTVTSAQSTTLLSVTGYNTNNAVIADSLGDSASLAGALTTLTGLEVNIDPAIATSVTGAYQAILRVPPSGAALNAAVSQIAGGTLSLSQFDASLIGGEQALYTSVAALVTIDAFYDATPSSANLTTVAAATNGTSYVTAVELHNLGYSDTNVWTVLASGWGADPTSNFFSQYDDDATGTTAGYTAFIDAVYAREFGAAPTTANLQNLLADVPGTRALLSGGDSVATPIQVLAGLYGYLLEVGQTNGIGQYASATTAFLQAAANGTVVYGPELTQEFPSTTSTTASVTGSADPSVITVTGSDQLIDPGTGDFTIQFASGTSGDTLVLHPGGIDQISGFDPGTDVLDLRSLLSEFAAPGNYLTVVDQGPNALLNFDPAGHGGGNTIAILRGLSGTVTGLDRLVADGAVRLT